MNRTRYCLALALTLTLAAIAVGCRKDETAAQRPATSRPSPGTEPTAVGDSATGTIPASQVPTTPPFAGGRATSFQEVTSQLDPGGSLFAYVSTEQWLGGLSTNMAQLQQVLLAMPDPDAREGIGRVFEVLTRLVSRSGIEKVNGVGLSAAPVAPGLFRNKFIVHRSAGATEGFLWEIFGAAAHPLTGLSMLPTNTALAMFADLDVGKLWTTLQEELRQSGVPQAAEMARQWPQLFEKQMQIPWAGLLECLAGEAGLILTLDDSQAADIPLGDRASINLPLPGLAVVIKINNSLLFDRLSQEMQSNPRAKRSEEDGVKFCSMPVPAPFPLEPTVALSDDYLFLASSPQVVRSIRAVRQGQAPGLHKSAAFADLARHLPTEGNQFFYVSRRFGETFADLQQQMIAASGMPPQQLDMIQRLIGTGSDSSFSLALGARTRNGWQVTSVGNKDSASAALLLPAVGVTAVGAGLLLPALAKAKAKAQSISTVNNVKQLALAARMYANDHQDKLPAAGTWCDDLKTFVGNPRVYKAANDPSPGRCSFAYNAKVSGVSVTRVDPRTVLFFEAENGEWNLNGGPELMLPQPRSGSYVIGFADGSVQMMTPQNLQTLRWDP
jgi:hypothetical protein